MGGFFHAMLGRTLSERYAKTVEQTVAAEKAKLAEQNKSKKDK